MNLIKLDPKLAHFLMQQNGIFGGLCDWSVSLALGIALIISPDKLP